ncbi:hypothetical protein OG800_29215 [Streptomyces sp. NBC_00445]|uniref:hypothetical protein n=1 Tax=Streptomyces sp. NBC_00445 TaxID=2975745 RepID=UPI002E242518
MAVVVATALICGTGVSAEAAVQKPPPAQASAFDVTESADGDLTLSYDSGESLDQDVLGLLVAQMNARNARLSDTIREDFQNYDVKTPGDGFTNWVSFDATISATPTGIDFVIPESEVHTEASWWQNIIAVTVGVAMQIFTRALCLGFLPAAAVVCASIGAFVGTVAGRFTVQGFDHQVTDGEAWASTLLYAVAAAAGAALWEAGIGAWAKTKLPELLRRAGEWLKNDLPRHLKGFWSWGKDAAIAAGTGVIRVAGWVYEKDKSFVPEWGSGNLPGRLRILDSGGTYEPDIFTADGTSHGVGFLFPGTWNYEFCVTAFNGSAESSRSECVVAPRPEDTAGDPGGNPGSTATDQGGTLDELNELNELNELTQALRESASMTG